MYRLINANYGVIRSVSHNKAKITIAMPRGGTFECRNEGFEIGQAVCFILDTLCGKILKVLPKEIADLQLLAGLNPQLQEASQSKLIDSDAEISDDIALMEEMTDANIPNNNIIGEGCSPTERIDIVSGMDRDMPEGWDSEDWPGSEE